MKTPGRIILACAGALLAGCTEIPTNRMPVMATAAYSAQEPIATSLFPSDQAILSDEAVAKILTSKLELPAKAKLALMKFPEEEGAGSYGRYYWRNEEFLRLQQEQVDALSHGLLASDQIQEVMPLPSLMMPSRLSISTLREAAVRMQADLLLIYRVGNDTYSQSRAFSKDRVKAYSTCELVLLDVRTGLVPFTRVVSREQMEQKQPADLDLSETMRRAEQTSSTQALNAAAEELVGYIRTVPKKGN
jgi:hypothetical protein